MASNGKYAKKDHVIIDKTHNKSNNNARLCKWTDVNSNDFLIRIYVNMKNRKERNNINEKLQNMQNKDNEKKLLIVTCYGPENKWKMETITVYSKNVNRENSSIQWISTQTLWDDKKNEHKSDANESTRRRQGI